MANEPELHDAITRAVVRLLAERTGRGPTKARTVIDRDLVVVLLENTLTSGERFLADSDRAGQVLDARAAYQEVMRPEYIDVIERLTKRTVAAFMSTNHIDPDMAAEIFMLVPEAA